MSSEVYTVDQVAGRLKLHPKTVLRYIRDGRLRGTRIGKSYRISRSDLEAFAGMAGGAEQASAQVTSVVEVADVSRDASDRIATGLSGAAMSRGTTRGPLHVQTAYQADTRTLKIVLVGSLPDTASLLGLVDLQLGTRS